MVVYIAGKITGNPNYKEQFTEAEKKLKQLGWTVLNPANNPEGLKRLDYMAIDIPMINTADTLYLLKNWRESEGAVLERHYCEYVGKCIIEEN